MHHVRRLVLLTVTAAGVLALGSAAGGADSSASSRAPKPVPVRVGFASITVLAWPFWAAEATGSFERAGLAPSVFVLGSSPQVTAALLGGSVDIGNTSLDIHVRSVEGGAETTWFVTEFANPIFGLLARRSVGSYADLRGETIIVDSPNSISFWLTRRMLSRAGLRPRDYAFVYAGGSPDRLAALKAGGVAAAILIQPFDFAAEREGFRRLGNSNEVVPAFEFTGYTARRDWLAGNADTVARFVRAYLDGQRWLYDPANKERAIEVLSRKTRLAPEDARATYELYVARERPFPAGGRINPAGVQAVLDAMVELGDLEAPAPPPARYIDTRYVD